MPAHDVLGRIREQRGLTRVSHGDYSLLVRADEPEPPRFPTDPHPTWPLEWRYDSPWGWSPWMRLEPAGYRGLSGLRAVHRELTRRFDPLEWVRRVEVRGYVAIGEPPR